MRRTRRFEVGRAAVCATVLVLAVPAAAVASPSSTPAPSGVPAARVHYATQRTLLGVQAGQAQGIAVDSSGTIYVADTSKDRVDKLSAGSDAATSFRVNLSAQYLPVIDDVAVDTAGNLFVSDGVNNEVIELADGSGPQTVLPFNGLDDPVGLAVDTAGDVFVADSNNDRIVELPAGSNAQRVIPLNLIGIPNSLAVDSAGNLYVTQAYNAKGGFVVDKVAAGTGAESILPIVGSGGLEGVAVDAAGDVFVADTQGNQVLELQAGSTQQVVVPFSGLSSPEGLALDASGDVLVTNSVTGNFLGPIGWVAELLGGSGPQRTLFDGVDTPLGLAVDQDGDLFIGNPAAATVEGKPYDSTNLSNVISHVGLPVGVAVDTAGDVFATDFPNAVFERKDGSANQINLHLTGLATATGVAVDPAGDLFVSDSGNHDVVEYLPGTTAPTTLPFTGLAEPFGVAVGPGGEVLVADRTANTVYAWTPGAASATLLPFTGLSGPSGVAVDPQGDIFVADSGNDRVVELRQSSHKQLTLAFSGLGNPTHVAVMDGDVYVADTDNNRVVELPATGQLIVSQFRLSGPAGAVDQYFELYNTTGAPLPLQHWALTYFDPAAQPPLPVSVQLDDVILPVNGTYLLAAQGYSLGTIAHPDQFLSQPVPPGALVSLVAPDGTGADVLFPPLTDPLGGAQYAYVRTEFRHQPVNTTNPNADFELVGPISLAGAVQGTPDPAGTTSLTLAPTLSLELLDPSAIGAEPNLEVSSDPATLTLRRVVTNNSGRAITALELRVAALTTNGTPGGHGALVPIASSGTFVTVHGVRRFVAGTTVIDAPGASAGLRTHFGVPLPSDGLQPGGAVAFEVSFAITAHGTNHHAFDLLARFGS